MKEKETFSLKEKNTFMKEAIKEALRAKKQDEVPIGAVIVFNKTIIARGHNLRETTQQAAAHAEMFAIEQACTVKGSFRLEDCQLFVTLEPCVMCSGAMLLARIPEIYFGAYDPKGGATSSLYHLLEDNRLNHRAYVEGGVLKEECGQLLTTFFKQMRLKKRKKD